MPLIPNQLNLLIEDREYFEDAQYYLASKIQSDFFSKRFIEKVQGWMNNPEAVKKSTMSYKRYSNCLNYRLKPDLKIFKKINWEQVVLNRKSSRGFLEKPILFSQLSNMLMMSCGLKENGKWLKKAKNMSHWPKRALPSGGAMYPLEYYILAHNVSGLPQGLYHYNVFEGVLSLINKDDGLKEKNFWAQKELFKYPSAFIFTTAIFERARVKYGSRALRYALLEAGGVGVQMNLTANAMNLDFCFDGGGYEDKIEELIGIDGREEGLISIFLVGHS